MFILGDFYEQWLLCEIRLESLGTQQFELAFQRQTDQRRYNNPSSNEIAMVFVNNDNELPFERDIRVYQKNPLNSQNLKFYGAGQAKHFVHSTTFEMTVANTVSGLYVFST